MAMILQIVSRRRKSQVGWVSSGDIGREERGIARERRESTWASVAILLRPETGQAGCGMVSWLR